MVRNWWIEVEIDGRKHKLVGGPQAKGGGFSLTVRQRDRGESRIVLTLSGYGVFRDTLKLVQTYPGETLIAQTDR